MNKIVFFIAASIALILWVLELMLLKTRTQKFALKLGERLTTIEYPTSKKTIIVLVCCPLLVLLSYITRMNTFQSLIACAVSIVAAEVVCKDFVVTKNAGLFEKALACNGQCVYFDKVEKITPLSSESDNQILIIDFKDSRKTQIGFSTPEECASTLQIIQKKKLLKK